MKSSDRCFTRDERNLRDLLSSAISQYRLAIAEYTKRGVSLRKFCDDYWQQKHGNPLSDAMVAMLQKEEQLLSCQRDVIGLAPVAGSGVA